MSDRADSASMRVKQALDLARRQSLLARMAGNIAGTLIIGDAESPYERQRVAERAVDIAERILQRIGL